ncbi:alpha/beta fold hydrolase [Williamsia sp.]|uniref:alpha/beta fold hydrolase n=1 Tax=Williamsia sp. TaxID=1872085 RepID=UPI001A337427|nr:alpha/beta fold hydrolase [Williamsia sp.]MBJ7288240.1 alpha/beta fold hydrolase [Williamsia sp.]
MTKSGRGGRFSAAFLVAVAAASLTTAVAASPAQAAPINWGPCPKIHGASLATQCTVLRMPRDYARPSAGTIAVTVSKLPARDQANKRGVLIGNPGGPGGDGIPMFSQLLTPAPLRDQWDLIAVQPRGLLDANPVACAEVSGISPAAVFTAGAVARSACNARTPGGTADITTANTARDIESARAQLGLGTKVSLLGISYGTTLMSTYATLFPQHVDRLILDSAVDPNLEWNTLLTAQTEGYKARVHALFAWIAQRDNVYHLGKTPLAVYRTWSRKVTAEAGVPPSLSPPPARVGDAPPALRGAARAYLAGVNTNAATRAYFDNLVASIATGKSQNASTLLSLTRAAAPSRDNWPIIAQRIIAAPKPAPKYPPDVQKLLVNSSQMQTILLCNENAVPARPQVAPASLLDSFVIGDVFTGPGYLYESGLACSGAAPVARPVRISNRGLATQPLQLQSVGDPQTPYRGGLVHRDRMGSHLITVGGGDHAQFGRANPVVDAAIVEYLRTGRTSVTSAPQAPVTTPLLPARR